MYTPLLQCKRAAIKVETVGLINRINTVAVILTYSTSKNYGVLDVGVSSRLCALSRLLLLGVVPVERKLFTPFAIDDDERQAAC